MYLVWTISNYDLLTGCIDSVLTTELTSNRTAEVLQYLQPWQFLSKLQATMSFNCWYQRVFAVEITTGNYVIPADFVMTTKAGAGNEQPCVLSFSA